MAKDTRRDRIWRAALEYGSEWDSLDFSERPRKYGWTAEELKRRRDLEASVRTVSDTLLTMMEYGYLEGVGGSGGQPTEFQLAVF